MCRFHSFLFNAATGDILDREGDVHHSSIAVHYSVQQDRFTLPEFWLSSRSLVFNDSRTLVDVMKSVGAAQSLTDREYEGAFTEQAWGRLALAERGGPFNAQALAKLQVYVESRFGSARGLIEFVEPQWEIAAEHCLALLGNKALREVSESGMRDLVINSAELSRDGGAEHLAFKATVKGLSPKTNLLTVDKSTLTICDGAGDPMPMPEQVQVSVNSPNVGISFALNAAMQEWLEDLSCDELEAQACVGMQGAIDFPQWSKLFEKKTNRVAIWKPDKVAIGV